MPEQLTKDFKHYIRIIGRGQRAGRTLTQQEAFEAMSLLISGQATDEQKGAFLMLLRVREETPEELAGFTQAFRAFTDTKLSALPVDLDLGCYAGKRRHLPWFLLAVVALAQSGRRIFLHGTHEPDSNRLYLSEVMQDLGFRIAKTVDEAGQDLNALGFAYMDLERFNQPLDNIIQLRALFGLRSCANTLARMLNPTQAPASLQGVFHRHVDEKHRQTAALLNSNDVLCFRGEGGEIEYNPERDVVLHSYSKGEQQCVEVPACLDNWVMKPKQLDPSQLKSFFEQRTSDDYGQQAVIGTLTIMLILLDGVDWQTGFKNATEIWNNRSKTWPVSVDQQHIHDHSFDTKGKHYAH